MHTSASTIINAFAFKRVENPLVKKLRKEVCQLDDSKFTATNKLIKKYITLLDENQESAFSMTPAVDVKKD